MINLEGTERTEEHSPDLTEKEIFTKIWTSPREVFKFLNDKHNDKYVHVLLVLAGIATALDQASAKNMGDLVPLFQEIVLHVLAGALFGWISYYIFAGLLSWTGEWLKGKGNTKSLLRMVAYATLPSTAALVLLVPEIALFGNGVFRGVLDTSDGDIPTLIVYVALNLIEIGMGIWSLVLFVIGISEVQKLSIGMSIVNLILPALVLIIPLGLVVLYYVSYAY